MDIIDTAILLFIAFLMVFFIIKTIRDVLAEGPALRF